ncbi:G patch domain-containing protein 11-like [Biomphalaria glabrata]|uniref:G patch domain-containing protein 11 n=1 Tax=Biomphalaria glabrata TaxID=6526 RepID=A0A9W2ZZM8_BIOGL|nr:G patch domain-containing protein 11-like [Biomphalaria glabrata]KAI8740688.1 G patch domain-containing protein 11-like [Biomphalaria glabrata]
MSADSSDEEDYMSDAFLQKCADTRPGLVPKRLHDRYEKEKKQKESQKQNKTVSKQKLEIIQREAGLSSSIPTESKGFALLQKMGYKPGQGIGKLGTGRIEPVPIEVKNNRLGLGKDTEMKRKAIEMNTMRSMMAVKRLKTDEKQRNNFLDRMREKFSTQSVDRDLRMAQNVCIQLDQEQGLTEPGEVFFWPASCLPLQENEGDDLQPNDFQEEKDDSDVDEVVDCPAYMEFSEFERLDILTRYLRNTYFYCQWCGVKYNDKVDLDTNCPGNTSEAHE